MWGLLSEIYHFDLMTLYVPTSMFQICITLTIGLIVFRRWEVPKIEKLAVILGFGLWGFGKSIISIVEALHLAQIATFYMAEIVFSNILNFLVFIIYLQRAESKLDLTKKQFKLIVENALDVIFFYEINPPCFSYITPSVEKVLGYSPKEFYGDNNFYQRLVEPSDYEKINKIFSYNDDDTLSKTAILKIFLKNDQPIWAEISTTVVYENNTPLALEGVIRDITTTKNAEAEMIATANSREVFLSYISHELKTPVTALLAYITALRDNTLTGDTRREEAFDIIYKKTLTLNKFILDIFQISKLETKQFSFEFMVMDAQDLIDEFLSNHRSDIEGAELKLQVKINTVALKNIWIIADAARMEQVFANILANAIRFSKKGEIFHVSAGLDNRKQNVLFSFKDYGCGIAEDDLPYIFNRYFQGKNRSESNEYTGGLGMTIAKEIVEAHGGTIFVRSRLQKGTTFTVSLPIYDEGVNYDQ